MSSKLQPTFVRPPDWSQRMQCDRGIAEVTLDLNKLVIDFRNLSKRNDAFPSNNEEKEKRVFDDTKLRLKDSQPIYMPLLFCHPPYSPERIRHCAQFNDGRHRTWALHILGCKSITVLVPLEQREVFLAAYSSLGTDSG